MNKKAVELFNKIQNIPYFCLRERDPEKLLKKNKGSCSEKHLFLGKALEELGIPIKYLLIKFDWNDLPIPKEIVKKKDSSIGYHLALKIKINNKWIYVDATFDPKLEKAGFPITKNWKGDKDTKLAFPPKEIIELKRRPTEQIERRDDREFYNALNKWLEERRYED